MHQMTGRCWGNKSRIWVDGCEAAHARIDAQVQRRVCHSSLLALFALALVAWLQLSVFQVDERFEENGVELVFDDDCLAVESMRLVLSDARLPRWDVVVAVPPQPVHLEREGRPPSRG